MSYWLKTYGFTIRSSYQKGTSIPVILSENSEAKNPGFELQVLAQMLRFAQHDKSEN
jgi:hypothetical protein